jgi:hypothetical protein
MVRAILDGRKTQTRRVVTPSTSTLGIPWPASLEDAVPQSDRSKLMVPGHDETWHRLRSRAEPGDWLWVRETWTADLDWPEESGHPRTLPWAEVPAAFRGPKNCTSVYYAADRIESQPPANDGYWIPREVQPTDDEWERVRWNPSIHMPRWACRIVLEVVSVRVERVQDITECDAEAEGVNPHDASIVIHRKPSGEHERCRVLDGTHRGAFACLWDSINAKRGHGWDANPWVWVVEFRRVE